MPNSRKKAADATLAQLEEVIAETRGKTLSELLSTASIIEFAIDVKLTTKDQSC